MYERVRALVSVGPASAAGNRSVLQRVRWRFVLLHLVTTLLAPLSLGQMTAAPLQKAAYLGTVATLTAWVVWLYRTAGRHQAMDLIGPVLIATVGMVVENAAWATGALYMTVFVHSLYGDRRRVLRNAGLYVLGYHAAVAAGTGLSGVLSERLISTTLAVVFMAWVMQAMAASLHRNDATRVREEVLIEAGRGLLRARDPQALVEAALDGVMKLTAEAGPDRRANLWRRDGDRLLLAGTAGPPPRADQVDLRDMPAGPVAVYLNNQPVRLGPAELAQARQATGVPGDLDHGLALPLSDGGIPLGLIFVETPTPLGNDVAATLQRFANEVSLAKQAARRNQLLRAVVDNSADGILLVDDELQLTFVSPAVVELAGRQVAVGESLGELLMARSGDRIRPVADLAEVAHGHSLLVRQVDGRHVEVEVSARTVPDEGTVLNIRDVSMQRRLEEEITYRAFHDPLTGLANRALFLDRLRHALARASRDQTRIAVALFDLDEFKGVNDRQGHLTGDAVLREVAARVTAHVRETDTVARLGGDEYAVLLEGLRGEDDLRPWLDRVLESVRRPLEVDGQSVAIAVSAGLTVADGAHGVEDVLGEADLALYAAKGSGRDGVAVFHADMRTIADERRRLRDDLGAGIASDQLRLYYQPVLSLADERLVGAEALVRWEHPTHGLLTPDRFIPLAEETSLIVPLGRWVLTRACAQLATWKAAGLVPDTFRLHINLSVRELADEHLVGHVEATLEHVDLDPYHLVVEVTETALATDPALAEQTLRRLRHLGIGVAIDDFGTGYASFTYLQRFPVDIIKIDRSFVTDVARGPEEAALARAIVRLADSLDLVTVAEGIEQVESCRLLADWGCDHAQGWLWSPAVTGTSFERWLIDEQSAAEVAVRSA